MPPKSSKSVSKTSIRPQKEVRFEYLKGREAMRRIQQKPFAFLPVGCLERHGDHLPMGLDFLKAHGICCACARAIGGVVFPLHAYAATHIDYKAYDNTPPRKLRKTYESLNERWGNCYCDRSAEEHLYEILLCIERMGVRGLVLYSGHYPASQMDMCRRLAKRFERSRKHTLRVYPFCEKDLFGTGDHAGLWETALYMALEPDQVDQTQIRPCNFQDHHWKPGHDPRDATIAFGEQAIRKIIRHFRAVQKELLSSPTAESKNRA